MQPDGIAVVSTVNVEAPSLVTLTAAVPAQNTQAVVLAQQFDQDIMGDLGAVFKNFIDSGQVWALIIGIVIGYVFRGMTTYK